MDMDTACKLLKTGKIVRFWYCAADSAGNPLLMLDKKRIPQKDIKAAKKTARKKQFCGGHMSLKKGVLTAFTDDGAPNLFDKKVKALLGDYIPRPREVEVKEAALADGLIQEEASDTGAQPLGEHYEGEDESVAWRADLPADERVASNVIAVLKKPKLRAALAEAMGMSSDEVAKYLFANKDNVELLREALAKAKLRTTKYFSDEEAAAATVGVDAEGRLMEGDAPRSREKEGFAIDATSGELRAFDPNAMGANEAGGDEMNHHSSPVRGKDVISAGHITTKDGRLTQIDDESGHYKPDATKTLQAIKHLEKLGVKMVDDRLLDERGRPVDERRLAPELKQRAKWLKAYEKAHQVHNRELAQAGVAERMLDAKYHTIRQELADAKVWFANKAANVKLIGKTFGITEEEWKGVKGNVRAINSLLEAKTNRADLIDSATPPNQLNNRLMVNEMVAQATSRTLTKEQFEQTGGNEAQIRAKDAMQAELLNAREPSDPIRVEAESENTGDGPSAPASNAYFDLKSDAEDDGFDGAATDASQFTAVPLEDLDSDSDSDSEDEDEGFDGAAADASGFTAVPLEDLDLSSDSESEDEGEDFAGVSPAAAGRFTAVPLEDFDLDSDSDSESEDEGEDFAGVSPADAGRFTAVALDDLDLSDSESEDEDDEDTREFDEGSISEPVEQEVP